MLKAECKSLDAMVDENNDLRAELTKQRTYNTDEKTEALAEENARLRKRNGELLIKSSDLEDSNAKLKDQIEFTKKPVVKEEGFERGKGY